MRNAETARTGMWRYVRVMAIVAGLVAPVAGTNDLCGTPVVEDLTLDADLACAGDGLVVSASGIKIDLNGHTISGTGTGVAILVFGQSDVTIMNGTITGFAVAVRTQTATDVVIKHTVVANNAEGLDFQAGSIGNTVKDNEFRGSTIRAIMLRGNTRDNDIKGNTFTGNRLGILLFGAADSTVKDNTISGSSVAAIRVNVLAIGNVLKDNLIHSNAVGFDFSVTPTGSAVGNEFKGNTLAANGCGINGPTAGNGFKDNAFEGNTADTCG
jgi:parallel beta-helix repeat protein